MPAKTYIWGLGRRKTSTARVRLAPGTGSITVNGRPLAEYIPVERLQKQVQLPFTLTESGGKWDVFVNVDGGGLTGQAGALVLGISRALVKADPSTEAKLRSHSLMTRDDRKVERKKYGLRGARRGCQFSKR